MELGHFSVRAAAGRLIAHVGALELLALVRFRRIGAGDPHAGNGALHFAVDLALLFPHFAERPEHPLAGKHCKQHDKGNADEQNHRQQRVDETKSDKRADDRNDGEKEIFRPVMRQFGDLEQVVDEAGHDGACLVFIEIRKRKALQLGEHLPAHIPLDAHAQRVPPVVDDIDENALDDVDRGEHARPGQQKGERRFRGVPRIGAEHVLRYNRIKDVADRHDERTDQIQREQFFMRPVISKKSSDHACCLFFCSFCSSFRRFLRSFGLSKGSISSRSSRSEGSPMYFRHARRVCTK